MPTVNSAVPNHSLLSSHGRLHKSEDCWPTFRPIVQAQIKADPMSELVALFLGDELSDKLVKFLWPFDHNSMTSIGHDLEVRACDSPMQILAAFEV
jgi:hypothetical protein